MKILPAGTPGKKSAMRPMAVTGSFKDYVLAQFGEFGDVTARAMFGGIGLYKRDLFFGIVAGDFLYLKVDDRNRPAFEETGMPPFKPFEDRSGTMQYYRVPVEVLESGAELARWAKEAVAVAERAAGRRDVAALKAARARRTEASRSSPK
jgi:DNA transformation protein and related proteins